MSTRRQFMFGGLAAVAAGCATKLERPVPNIIEPWTELDYGSDLDWVTGSWTNVVDPGNGYGVLRYRRVNGIFFWDLDVLVGSTTSFPSAGQWYFELPDLFDQATASVVPATTWGAGISTDAGTHSYQTHFQGNRAITLSSVTKPALLPYPNEGTTGYMGAATTAFPFAWANGDTMQGSGWIGALDN